MKEIYQQTAEEVLERVESKKSGLTDEQVRRSREKCGWNELAEGKKKSILQIFFEQYKDCLLYTSFTKRIIIKVFDKFWVNGTDEKICL